MNIITPTHLVIRPYVFAHTVYSRTNTRWLTQTHTCCTHSDVNTTTSHDAAPAIVTTHYTTSIVFPLSSITHLATNSYNVYRINFWSIPLLKQTNKITNVAKGVELLVEKNDTVIPRHPIVNISHSVLFRFIRGFLWWGDGLRRWSGQSRQYRFRGNIVTIPLIRTILGPIWHSVINYIYSVQNVY